MIRTLVLASLVLGATPALAQETQASVAAKFHREFVATDVDKDGSWSLAEVQKRTAHMRPTKGSDPALGKKLAQLWFSRADANKDRKVTEREAQALLAATFKAYDADGDGKIGTTERATAKKAIVKGR